MPTPQPSSKRPSLLAWIIILSVGVVIIAAVTILFTGTNPQVPIAQNGSVAVGAPAYRTGTAVSGMMGTSDLAVESAPMMAPVPSGVPATGGSAAASDSGTITQRIIKTGELSLRVQDAAKALEDAQTIAASKNGFVESSSLSDAGAGPRTAWLTIRVPADAYDATVNELKAHAVLVLSESTHGQDVTSQFVDLDAALRNAQAEEASYLDIMKRAGKIDEVLQVARALADVRGRIEQLQGRMRFMTNQTDLATITVTLTEETRVEVPGRTWKPMEVLNQALSDLVTSLQNLVDLLIRLVIWIVGLVLPIVLLCALVAWIVWKIYRAVTRRSRR